MKTIEDIKENIRDWNLLEEDDNNIEVYFENDKTLIIEKIYFLEFEFIELDTIAEVIYQNNLQVL